MDDRKEFIMEHALKTFKCFDRPLELGRYAALPLAQARGAFVRSLRGTLWVTQDGDSEDHFVRAGESFTIERDGVTLVSTLQYAGTVLVTQPAVTSHPRRDGGTQALAGAVTRIPAADRESIVSKPHSEPAGLTYADVARDPLLMQQLMRQARRAQAAAIAEMFAAAVRALGSGLRRVASALAVLMRRD
jgi:hypothetical protein